MNTRTLDDPLPEFVTKYLETVVDPIRTRAKAIVDAAKDLSVEDAMARKETLVSSAKKWNTERAALVEKIDTLSDSEATRVLNVLSEKEESMVAALRAAIQALGLKKGARRRATRGRRARKATRRGRRGHW